MNHVVSTVPFYRDRTLIPGYDVGGKTGTAQIWDPKLHGGHGAWKLNIFNYSFVGYIARQKGHPDLIVGIRIEEGTPTVAKLGQLEMPVMSFELFRRIAHDAITTPGPPAGPDGRPRCRHGRAATARPRARPRPGEQRLCDTGPRDRSPRSVAPVATDGSDRGLTADELAAATGGSSSPVPSGRSSAARSTPARSSPATSSSPCRGSGPTATLRRRGARRGRGRRASSRALPDDVRSASAATRRSSSSPTRCRPSRPIAIAWRPRFDPLVVGITGSIAKTSTKEAVAAVLGAAMPTLKNEGNLNNEIGLPLTVLRLRAEHRAAVLEMGMYVGGEIADLARIGRPEIGIVTAVQPVHLSRIGTIEAIEQAKGELVEALPDDGVAILNADDERVRRMAARTRGAGGDLRVRRRRRRPRGGGQSRGADGMAFDLVAGRRPGRSRSRRSAASRSTTPSRPRPSGRAAGLPVGDIVDALAGGWSAPHRTQLVRAGGVTIVDDSLQRVARLGRRRPGAARRAARPAGRGPRRDAGSSALDHADWARSADRRGCGGVVTNWSGGRR